jgi:hypothetical protein
MKHYPEEFTNSTGKRDMMCYCGSAWPCPKFVPEASIFSDDHGSLAIQNNYETDLGLRLCISCVNRDRYPDGDKCSNCSENMEG